MLCSQAASRFTLEHWRTLCDSVGKEGVCQLLPKLSTSLNNVSTINFMQITLYTLYILLWMMLGTCTIQPSFPWSQMLGVAPPPPYPSEIVLRWMALTGVGAACVCEGEREGVVSVWWYTVHHDGAPSKVRHLSSVASDWQGNVPRQGREGSGSILSRIHTNTHRYMNTHAHKSYPHIPGEWWSSWSAQVRVSWSSYSVNTWENTT